MKPAIDDIDRKILRLLVENARTSSRSIARDIEMSPSAVSERVARLEREQVILGYHAAPNGPAMGFDLGALVGLQIEQGPPLADTMKRLSAIPEIISLHIVTGRWDMILRLVARDQYHLQDLILNQIWEIPGFRHGETMLLLRSTDRPTSWLSAATEGAKSG